MAIMAIDYGDAHTGIAISDPTGTLAGFCNTIRLRKSSLVIEQILPLLESHQVDTLVLGFPKNMDGTESRRADIYRKFAQELETASGLCPILWDERRSTIEATQILSNVGKKKKSHKKTIDAVAASLILEGYLSFLRQSTSGETASGKETL